MRAVRGLDLRVAVDAHRLPSTGLAGGALPFLAAEAITATTIKKRNTHNIADLAGDGPLVFRDFIGR